MKNISLIILMFFNLGVFAQIIAPEYKNKSMDKLWKEVDKFNEKRLPESANEVLEAIIWKSRNKSMGQDYIKAVYEKYRSFTQKDGALSGIDFIKQELELCANEDKNMLHFLLARAYTEYFIQNQYEIASRTQTKDILEIGPDAWTVEQFQNIILDLFNQIDKDYLKAQKTKDWKAIVNHIDLEAYRPSLFDLVFHSFEHIFTNHAFLKNNTFEDLTSLDKLFDNAAAFVDLDLDTYDSNLAEVFRWYQVWLKHHFNTKNIKALGLADVTRIELVYRFSKSPIKDSLYVQALNQAYSKYDPLIETRLRYKEIQYYVSKGDHPIDKENGYQKAMALIDQVEQKKLDNVYTDWIQNLKAQILQEQIDVKVEKEVIPNEYVLLSLLTRNAENIDLTLFEISPEKLEHLNRMRFEQRLDFIKKLKKRYNKSIDVPKFDDYSGHRIETDLPPVKQGLYLVLVEGEEESGYTTYQASSIITQQLADDQLLVVDRINGNPLSEAIVFLEKKDWRSKEVELKELQTNTSGLAQLPQGNWRIYKVEKDDQILICDERIYQTSRIENAKRLSLSLLTDRGIYRPGDRLHFKGILLEEDKTNASVVSNQSIEIQLNDANGQEVFTKTYKTNAFGSFSDALVLPEGLRPGMFSLQSQYGRRTFRVEEYRPPSMKLELKTDDNALYKLGDTVEIHGKVAYFSGIQINRGTVKYRIIARSSWRPYPYHLNYSIPSQQSKEVAQGVVDLNEAAFVIPFEAKYDKDWRQVNYSIEVDFTDQAGETISQNMSLALNQSPYQVSTNIGDLVRMNDLGNKKFNLINYAGKAVNSPIKIEVSKLSNPESGVERYWEFPEQILLSEAEFRTRFPKYPFQNPAKELLEIEEQVYTNDYPKAQVELKRLLESLNANQIYELKVKDEAGKQIFERRFEYLDNQAFSQYGKSAFRMDIPEKVLTGQDFEWQAKHREDSKILLLWQEEGREIGYKWSNSKKLTMNDRKFQAQALSIQNNRVYNSDRVLISPISNQAELQIDSLFAPDQIEAQNDYAFKVATNGESELTAVFYDAALDEIAPNNWRLNRINFSSFVPLIDHNPHLGANHFMKFRYARIERRGQAPEFPAFYFTLLRAPMYRGDQVAMDAVMIKRRGVEQPQMAAETRGMEAEVQSSDQGETPNEPKEIRVESSPTVFFIPEVHQNEDNTFELPFRMSDGISTYKFMVMAHDKAANFDVQSKEVISSKPLMITPFFPRILREGDEVELVAKVQNSLEEAQIVNIHLKAFHALNGDTFNGMIEGDQQKQLAVQAGESKVISWSVKVPSVEEVPFLEFVISAKSEQASDAVQKLIEVQSSSIVLRSRWPIEVNAGEKVELDLGKWNKDVLHSNNAKALEYGISIVEQPTWYAIQALPYLNNVKYKNAIAYANALYANGLSTKIAQEVPNLRAILLEWKKAGELVSPLEKYEDKGAIKLEESPWVSNAIQETAQMNEVVNLLDASTMQLEWEQKLHLLKQMQNHDGGFSWCPGMRSSWYTTQAVALSLIHIKQLNVKSSSKMDQLLAKSIQYMDKVFEQKKNRSPEGYLFYYYIRSLYGDNPETENWKELHQAMDKKWDEFSIDQMTYLGLAWFAQGKKEQALSVAKSIVENSIKDDKIGAYWNQNQLRRTYTDDIEMQSLRVELLMRANQMHLANQSKKWLLKNKQTNQWGNSKNTAAAIHAILVQNDGYDIPKSDVKIKFDQPITWSSQSNVKGYYQSYQAEATDNSFPVNTMSIKNKGESILWGDASVKYKAALEDVKGTQSDDGFSIEKTYFKKVWTDEGERLIPLKETDVLKVGEVLSSRIILKVDRSMDFVHINNQRAINLEPIKQLSGYRFRDGIGYYESYTDEGSHIFIDHLPKGTFVFELDERVSFQGNCSGGVQEVECMYAPTFRAHTAGSKIAVK